MKKNSNKKYKLAYFVRHPIVYQAPLLKKLSERDDLELDVFFVSDITIKPYYDIDFDNVTDWDTPLLDGYSYKFLKKLFEPKGFSFFLPLVSGYYKALRSNNYDAIWIHGYNHWSLILVMILSIVMRVPLLYRAESNLKSTKKGYLKDIFIKFIVKFSKGLMYIGEANKRYYKYYGAEDEKLFFTPYAVDNSYFSSINEGHEIEAYDLRESLFIKSEDLVFLFVGKLMNRKNPILLLEAFNQLRIENRLSNIKLIFVGDGPQYNEIKKKIVEYNLEEKIILSGFAKQEELRLFYLISNVLVLPSSEETFGLVINEAMNVKTAIISSDNVGASIDLVKDGTNGFIFNTDDLDSLTLCLKRAIEKRKDIDEMCHESKEIISQWGYDQDIEGIMMAIKSI